MKVQKLLALVYSCLFGFSLQAQTIKSPEGGYFICTDLSEKAISDKLEVLDTLADSDDNLSFSLRGNPILSYVKYQYIQMSESRVERKGNLLVLHTTLVPLPRVVSYPGAASKLLPHFSLLCKQSYSPVKLICKQETQLPHFIMDDFKLSLEVVANTPKCPGQNGIRLAFLAQMDGGQYAELQEYIKLSPRIKKLPSIILKNIDLIFKPEHLYNSYLFALYQSFFLTAP